VDDENFSNIISEIFEEVTVVYSDVGEFYFKHFTPLDLDRINYQKKKYIQEAKRDGVETQEDALQRIIKDGLWTNEQEFAIQRLEAELSDMRASLSALNRPSQIRSQKSHISKKEGHLNEILTNRHRLVGFTAELLAEKASNRDFIEKFIFWDSEFKKPVFESIPLEEGAFETHLLTLHKEFFEKFDEKNISKAVLSPAFAAYFAFAEDSMAIFGKPLKDMTFFQLRLVSYARSFLGIFKNCTKDIPDHIARDPEALVGFYESTKEQQSSSKINKSDTGGTVIFGGEQEDLDALASEGDRKIKVQEELKKRGGSMGMKDFMKIHSV
jgi:hypothetical protein